jgi:glycosyltransferase 2 family protein
MRTRLRQVLVALIILAAFGVVLYRSRHVLHLGDFNLTKLGHAVRQANIPMLLLSIVGVFVCYAIRALRWRRFARYTGPTTFWNVFSGTVMGFAAIFVLGRPGEPVRPLLLARKDRLPAASMFGIFVLERLFDFSCAFLLAIISIFFLRDKLIQAGADPDWTLSARRIGWILVVLLAVLVALPIYFRLHGAGELHRRLQGWRSTGGWRQSFAGAIAGFSDGLQAIRTPGDILVTAFYSVVHWAFVALIFVWIAQAFGDPFAALNYAAGMLILAITLVGSTLQLPTFGGGTQLASFVALTTIFGVETEPAAAVAIVLWLITFASSLLLGVPLFIHEGMTFGELRQLAKAEAKAEDAGTHVPTEKVAEFLTPLEKRRREQREQHE